MFCIIAIRKHPEFFRLSEDVADHVFRFNFDYIHDPIFHSVQENMLRFRAGGPPITIGSGGFSGAVAGGTGSWLRGAISGTLCVLAGCGSDRMGLTNEFPTRTRMN
jgi:hypothetical protein